MRNLECRNRFKTPRTVSRLEQTRGTMAQGRSVRVHAIRLRGASRTVILFVSTLLDGFYVFVAFRKFDWCALRSRVTIVNQTRMLIIHIPNWWQVHDAILLRWCLRLLIYHSVANTLIL